MAFKNNLQTIRKFNHLSQEKLANRVGVSRQSVSKWETGEAYPTTANMVAICSVLHCKVTDLIDINSKEPDSFTPEARKGIAALEQKDRKRLLKLSKALFVVARIARIISLLGFVVAGITLYALWYPTLNFLFADLPEGVYLHNLTFLDFFQYGIALKMFLAAIIASMYLFAILYTYLMLRETESFFKRISKRKSPFCLENTLSLKKISKYLVLEILFSTIPGFLFLIIDPSYKVSLNLPAILIALITICFVYIFRYGHILETLRD